MLRAAQSEVELYNRIEFGTVDTDISVAAHAVNDVVRLVAELLDNATRFSPPNTTVVADGRRIRDYVLIQVEDRGLGLTDEQLDSLNRRLAAPPTVDVAAFRLMGLAVVSRLASRLRHPGRAAPQRRGRHRRPGDAAERHRGAARQPGPGRRRSTRPRQPLAVEQPPPSPGRRRRRAGRRRAGAATLTDQWRTSPPAPAPWQPPVDARDTTPAVRLGGPSRHAAVPPVSGARRSRPAGPARRGRRRVAVGRAPTAAHPTVDR